MADLGEFTQGEDPDPLEYQFQDSTGAPRPITGFSAKLQLKEQWDTTGQTLNATVSDGPAGKVTYTWTGAELAYPGHWTAQFFVGDGGTVKFASVPITFKVRRALGPVPSI